MTRAVFLDKDGTLIDDVPYNVAPEHIRLAAGARAGVEALARAGFRLIVVTNQSGVARGYFPEAALQAVEARLALLLDGQLDGFYYCPHHPEGSVPAYTHACFCRKPAPGMVLQAARDHGIVLERSWLVGDILNDIEAGRRAGCRTVLLDNGHETEWLAGALREPDYRAADLGEAARIILAAGEQP